MRLDPVYLVEPKPAVPSIPTRRAFLVAGGTFAFGLSIGGACGYAMGAASAGATGDAAGAPKETPTEIDELKPSGDVELDEMRRLAVKAPIDELIQQQLVFVDSYTRNYRHDLVLWRGLERLCEAILTRHDYPDRRRSAMLLAQTVEKGEPGLHQLIGDRVIRLRAIR